MNIGKSCVRIQVQSISDVITNSSSELFVFQESSVKDVIELLDRHISDWRYEYEEPILFMNMSEDMKIDYIDYVSELPYSFNFETNDAYNQAMIKAIHRDLCVPEEQVPKLFENWNKPDIYAQYTYYNLKLSQEGYNLYKDKYKYDICLWSINENPDWNKQEQIMYILGGKRYHLG